MTYEDCERISDALWEQTNLTVEDIQEVVVALEKQIPKKPIERMALFEVRRCCPVCKDVLHRPYPCTCGQCIDWEVEE